MPGACCPISIVYILQKSQPIDPAEAVTNHPNPAEIIHPNDCKPQVDQKLFYGLQSDKSTGWSILVMLCCWRKSVTVLALLVNRLDICHDLGTQNKRIIYFQLLLSVEKQERIPRGQYTKSSCFFSFVCLRHRTHITYLHKPYYRYFRIISKQCIYKEE